MKTKLSKLAGVCGVGLVALTTSAIEFDLVNNSSASIPGLGGQIGIFDKSSLRTSGTGAVDPFLRVHNNSNFEQGFNTSAGGNPPDGFNAINGVWTHDLELSTLTYVNRGGINYFQFMLDLGEPGGGQENLLLAKFNLYTGNAASPTFGGIGGNPDNLGTKRWDLGGNTIMLLDENSGNGQADVNIFVPVAAFGNTTDQYLYLYTELGVIVTGGNASGTAGGTFEEFAALTGPRPPGPDSVPDSGSTLLLLGSVLTGFGMIKRRFNK